MENFTKLIAPLTPDKFVEDVFNKTATHIKGNSEKFSDLITWDELNNSLNVGSQFKSNFRMYKDRRPVPFKDNFDMIKNTQNGVTLIAENFDCMNNKIGVFHDSIENELGERTRSNLYISFPSVQGFSLHYDTHDFFIIQLFGKKRWQVYPATIEQPLFHLKEHATNNPPAESSMYLDCVLEQGDVLYVPKGHWHEVVAEGDELSVHLTLAVFVRNGIDYLEWLTGELRELPFFRTNFPLTLEGIDKSNSHLDELKERLQQVLSTDNLHNSFMQARYAAFKNRSAFNYPFHIFNNCLEENMEHEFVKSPSPVHITIAENDITVVAPKTLIKLPIVLKEAVEYVFQSSSNVISTEEIVNRSVNRDLGKQLIEKLITEGLIRRI